MREIKQQSKRFFNKRYWKQYISITLSGLLFFLFFPIILLYGYIYYSSKYAGTEEKSMEKIQEVSLKKVFKKGVMALLITILAGVLLEIAFLVLILLMSPLLILFSSSGSAGIGLIFNSLGLWVLIILVLILLLIYIISQTYLFTSLILYAKEESFEVLVSRKIIRIVFDIKLNLLVSIFFLITLFLLVSLVGALLIPVFIVFGFGVLGERIETIKDTGNQ